MFNFDLNAWAQGNPLCQPCPAGMDCSNQTTLPPPCSTGYYSQLASPLGCRACPAGSACPSAHLRPTLCAEGQHTNGQQLATACTDCAAGYACPSTRCVGWQHADVLYKGLCLSNRIAPQQWFLRPLSQASHNACLSTA